MRRLPVLIFALLLALPLLAQTKHPFTFEDMMALKRVGEPAPSPGGKWVLFSAVDVDLAANTKTPHIWIVPLGVPHPSPDAGKTGDEGVPHPSPEGRVGDGARVLIGDQDADRPRWAPEGKRFLFVSTKEGGSQVWIADFDATAGSVTRTHKLTSIATEAAGPLWSPDGKNILFVSDVYPECPDEACNAKKVDEASKSKVKALIFTRLLYRHWNAYKEGKRTHIFVIPADACVGTAALGCPAGVARDLTPGDYDSPVFSLGGQDNYAFSPDGQEICYTSNHDEVEAISTNNDLWIVSVKGGPAKNITADNPASDSTPLYSPNGKYIAYRAQVRPGYEADRFRLMLYDRATGKITNLTENFDRWVGSFRWAGRHEIFFTAENDGGSPIYWIMPEICLERCHPIELVDGYNDDIAAIETETEDTVLFSRVSVHAPTEVFIAEYGSCVIDLEKIEAILLGQSKEPLPPCAMANARQLTHLNDSLLSQVAMSPLETFWFEGAAKAKVQGFLVKPPNFDAGKKYPVKFLIHGGPQGAWGDDWSYRWNPELFAANGYVVVMINPRGSTGYGQKFIDEINGDWGGKVFEDLMKGLDYAEKTYSFIDKDRECALGASYGGYAVNWILGHTNRFQCLVSHDGVFNTESAWGTTEELWFNEWEFKGTPWTNRELYRKWSPHLSAISFKTPTLVVHGQKDYRLDVSEGLQLFTTLQRLKVPSKMLYFPDEGHWVLKPQNGRLWYQTVNDWVDQWTKK
jgi:dipeptidyl aminopeptidase/acylaminoacyl peptidase